MFTQVVVFATPPFALVSAIFLNRTPHLRLARFGSRLASHYHADLFSGFSTTRHCKGPSLTGPTTILSVFVRGPRLRFYPHLVGAGGERAADVIAQVTPSLIVVEPGLLRPVEVQSYVLFGQASTLISNRRPDGGTGAGDPPGGAHAGYRNAAGAIACGLTSAGTLRPGDPD